MRRQAVARGWETCPEKREKRNERSRLWSQAHPKETAEHSRAWREANPEKSKAAVRRWKKANPEKVREYRRGHPSRPRRYA